MKLTVLFLIAALFLAACEAFETLKKATVKFVRNYDRALASHVNTVRFDMQCGGWR
jgi:hypothetical protein